MDTSDEQCSVICMMVTNPGSGERPLGWEKRVNDIIRALRDERNDLRSALQNLHDDCAEYIKLNYLYRKDGKSAIWNQVMREARKALDKTEFVRL